jgi:hypothetical protein
VVQLTIVSVVLRPWVRKALSNRPRQLPVHIVPEGRPLAEAVPDSRVVDDPGRAQEVARVCLGLPLCGCALPLIRRSSKTTAAQAVPPQTSASSVASGGEIVLVAL